MADNSRSIYNVVISKILSIIKMQITDSTGANIADVDATGALKTTATIALGAAVEVNNGAGAAAVNIQDGGNAITVDGTVAVSNITACNTGAVVVSSGTITTITNPVAVTTLKPDGTNTMPSGDAIARGVYVRPSDGTYDIKYLPAGTAYTSNNGLIPISLINTANNTMTYFVNDTLGADARTAAGFVASGLLTAGRNYAWSATSAGVGGWDRVRVPFFDGDAQVSGASGSTLIAALAGKKARIHDLILSVDTAGLVTVSDGIGAVYMAVNSPFQMNLGQGKKQGTANTAITITNAAGGNVTGIAKFNYE